MKASFLAVTLTALICLTGKADAGWTPCKTQGQKRCVEFAPGFSGRCVIKGRPGTRGIYYRVYPRKIRRIRCVTTVHLKTKKQKRGDS